MLSSANALVSIKIIWCTLYHSLKLWSMIPSGGNLGGVFWYGCASQNFKTYPNHILGLRKKLPIHMLILTNCLPIHIPSFDFHIHSLLSFTNKYCNFVSMLVSELNF